MIDIGADLQRAFDEGYEKGQADRPQGEWEVVPRIPLDNYKCSECGAYSPCDYNFCSHCGAKMKGVSDGR